MKKIKTMKWLKKAAAIAVASMLAAPVVVANVGAVAADEDVELMPLARWEFNDEANLFKDSMGNFDLTVAAKEGGNTADPRDTGTVVDGKWVCDGDDILTLPDTNDIGEVVNNGFTLNFEMQQNPDMPAGSGDQWMAPVSFGFNDWTASSFCRFLINANGQSLRTAAHKITPAYNNPDMIDGYWTTTFLETCKAKMYKITLSVRPGQTYNVYVDGALKYTKPAPEGWTPAHANMKFSIGGETVWGNGYNFFNGTIDNVSIYNFAMNADQVNNFWGDKKIMVSEMGGEVITSISDQPIFTDGIVNTQPLTDALTTTQLIKRMNTASVNAIFANEQTVKIPVTWARMEYVEAEDKYYVIGKVNTRDIGYATTLTGETEVKTEVKVTRKTREVVIDKEIYNGTVVADKTEAYLNEIITFTVTPQEGYELVKLTVNGDVIEADENGAFTYKVDCNGDIEVYAEFAEAAQAPGGDAGDAGNSDGGASGGIGCLLAGCKSVVAFAVVAVLAPIVFAAVKLAKKED